MRIKTSVHKFVFRLQAGFSLEEVVMSIALSGLSLAGIISGYVLAAQRVDWSAYSFAAQTQAQQRIEQTRAAKWDTMGNPQVDEVVSSNFPQMIAALDFLKSSTNVVYGTNKTTITTLSVNPPLKMVQVDCIWSYHSRGPFTNTVITYRSPNQ